ncbi:GNAT family N-acetyltransferase [Nocardioides sp.]|uniref:GNAT family N-acetyltransferase n=1 Tax=Nocardioides sp. TaxID=35761 RepID=UPI002ECFB8DF
MADLEFHDDPAAFLAAAGGHLAEEPVVSTVVATVAEQARADDRAGVEPTVPYRWWVIARDDTGAVIGAGMRTAPFTPYPLFLLPMPHDAAISLARHLHARNEPVTGVNGALPAARTCAEQLARLTGGDVVVAQHTRLHRLDTLVPPRPVPGRLRPARPEDVGLALAWFEAFARDADEQAGRPAGSMHDVAETEASMLRRIKAGRLWFWTDEGADPVHLTGVNEPAFGAARIGPVYTPKEHRGRGYAGATVAALSQRVLDEGAVPCLFTDQANPASNALYAALGYRPVVDMVNLLVR